jgi:carbonic anhydrase
MMLNQVRPWIAPAVILVMSAFLLTIEQTPALPSDPGDARGRGPVHDAHVQDHWAYNGIEGPEHWGMLTPAYMACEAGSHQSPIDIRMAHHANAREALAFEYHPMGLRVVNNGHTIQVNAPPGNVLRLNGERYTLRQFHFHQPSEHHVEGKGYAMELHLVHQGPVGQVVVVAVLMEEGSENHVLARFWTRLPKRVGEESTVVGLNAADLLPTQTHYYTYEGSLTTPPCTEGVRWIVLKEPVQVSPEQATQFGVIVGHDARPLQLLHEREVREF